MSRFVCSLSGRSRKVVAAGTGVVLNAECYADGSRVTRVGLPQSRELSIGQRDTRVGQIAMCDVLIFRRSPVTVGCGGNSPPAKNGTQSDHGVRFFVVRGREAYEVEGERG